MPLEGHSGSSARRRRLPRRRLFAIGAAGLAASAIGCSKSRGSPNNRPPASSSEGTPRAGGTLTPIMLSNATTLDPQGTLVGFTLDPAGGVHSRLLQFKTGVDPQVGEDHTTEGDLAMSAESADPATWTLKLRPDARFQNISPVNGHPVEAEDVKATFTRALDPQRAGVGGLGMIDPNQIETPAKDTVVFKLKYPYAPFRSILASSIYSWILPREALAGAYDPAKQMIGSGPFILDHYTPDVEFSLKKNPDWFVKGRPYIDEVRWPIIGDTAQGEAQFSGGHVDIIGNTNSVLISANDLGTMQRQNPKAQAVKTPRAGNILYVQLGDPASPFQDVRLRHAVSMAIDRNALSSALYGNQVDTAEPTFYSSALGAWGLRQSDVPAATGQYYQFNPGEAKKLLEASGFADRQFKLVYALGYTGELYERTSQALGNMLSTAGFKIGTVSLDFLKDFVAGGKGIRYGNYPSDTIVSFLVAPYDDIDQFLFNYFDSHGTTNICRVHDADLETMIAKARTIVDDNDRRKAYIDIQKYLADKMYTIAGLPSPWQFTMVQPRVRNYQQGYAYAFATETFTKLWLEG